MISIIIPVYNVRDYLDICLSSIAAQSYSDWECILVDDGSRDGSGELCDKWAEKESRMHVVHQENSGVSCARNRGLGLAKGEYVVFVDSDDYVDADYLSNLSAEPSADLFVTGVKHMRHDNTCVIFEPLTDARYGLDVNNMENFIDLNNKFLLFGPVSKRYRLSVIRENAIEFPVGCSFGEDLQFNYNYLRCVDVIAQRKYSGYCYRCGDGCSLSTKVRPNRFVQDYEQWRFLWNFFHDQSLLCEMSKDFLYKRLWGIVYDGIFSTTTPNKVILSIPEIRDLKSYKHVFDCSWWIKFCIVHRLYFVFRR